MKYSLYTFAAAAFMALAGCSKVTGDATASPSPTYSGEKSDGSSGGAAVPGGNPGGTGSQPGVITAGEWNDLAHWTFWKEIITKEPYHLVPHHWKFFPHRRVAVRLVDMKGAPVIDALIQLKQGTTTLYTARTDNKGTAELWAGLLESNYNTAASALQLDINGGRKLVPAVTYFDEGVNVVTLPDNTAPVHKIEVAFAVDATGSMGDELEYLKTELLDVINRVKGNNPAATVATASVFYRDEGDEYVTRVSNFSTDPQSTINFIKAQRADAGGDWPEAVHTALEKSVNELQWSASARSRLLFLLLDAPPHDTPAVLKSLQATVPWASAKGVKIIPITASGIDKDTEFLMRFFALATNGTYVFVTNHSGIGGDHLEPTVGEYDVEFLNNLMVRLINHYAQ